MEQDAPEGGDPDEWPEWEPPAVQDYGTFRFDFPLDTDSEPDGSVSGNREVNEDATEGDRVPLEHAPVRGWALDPVTDTYFRRATGFEVRENHWKRGDVLVVAPGQAYAMGQGVDQVLITVPLRRREGPREILGVAMEESDLFRQESLRLERRRSYRGSWMAQWRSTAHGTAVAEAFQPLFHAYAQPGMGPGPHRAGGDDVFVDALADDHGGLRVNIVQADRMYVLDGPHRGAVLEHRLPRVGASLMILRAKAGPLGLYNQPHSASNATETRPRVEEARTATNRCDDGFDNDASGYADVCDFDCIAHFDYLGVGQSPAHNEEDTKSFGIFGDAMFCSSHPDNWWTLMQDAGDKAALLLNQIDPPNTDLDAPVLRFVMGGCAVMTDTEGNDVSRECQVDGQCLDGFSGYPYRGIGPDENTGGSFGRFPGGYIGAAWGMVNWMVEAMALGGGDAVAMHMVVIWGVQLRSDLAGRAYADWENDWMGNRGAAVADPGRGHLPVAHELGHLLGLPHDDAHVNGHPGVMAFPTGGYAPVLGNAVDDFARDNTLTPYENWVTYPPDKMFPRPSGFMFRGCVGDSECEYYPGLRCRGTGDGYPYHCARADSRRVLPRARVRRKSTSAATRPKAERAAMAK